MEDNLLNLNDIFVDMSFNSRDEFFNFITKHLRDENKIKSNFKNNILERENSFPTGLDTGKIGVALPHTDYKYSNTNQLVITTLADPLSFQRMDDPDRVIRVSIIILILFDKPEKQPTILKKIMEVIQNQKILQQIKDQNSAENVLKILKKYK